MLETDSGYELLSSEDKLLWRIRNRFDYAKEYWREIYEDGKADTKFVALDQWDGAEARARKDAVRPMLVMDEINQNLNQLINSVRQNKRGVKVVPRGFGANDKTAELRGDLIREIEYKSHAQSAYISGFQSICIAGYGGWVLRRQYVSEKGFDQEIVICRIPNAESSYPDPDCKKADFSDARYWFLLDLIPKNEYSKRFPNAKILDFDERHYQVAANWLNTDTIQVAEYFEVQEEERKLLLVKTPTGPMAMFEDEIPAEMKGKIVVLDERKSQRRKIKQYITNGVEILETNDEPGKYIPIIWGTGKELYVDSGSGAKRVLMSMVRGAKDPQRMLNYYATGAAEMVGMTPKTPFIGVAGQFHNPDNWSQVNTVPQAFLEYKAKIDGLDQLLPPPQRQPYDPPIEKFELGKESCRRSIQAALGMNPLPTNAQKLNDKSGVALKQIDDEEDRGTFHFVDNFEMMLEHGYRVINNQIPYVYDAQRALGMRNAKDEHRVVEVNKENEPDSSLVVGEHEVTISVGPSFASEREQANEFVKTVVPQIENIIQDPPTRAKFMALLIQTQNIGPIGDEMVKLLNPDDQTAQQLQSLQAQLAQANQMVVGLKTENDQLYAEKKGKIVDNEYAVKMKQMDNEVKLAIAEVTTKAQMTNERESLVHDLVTKLGIHLTKMAHEAATQAVQHAHEHSLKDKEIANAQVTQDKDQAHEAALATAAQSSGSET